MHRPRLVKEGSPKAIVIDRDEERRELAALARRGRPVLALLTGRRRIGKTFLLTNTWETDEVFLFSAARTTPELNRQQLLQDLAQWTDEAVQPGDYPNWRTVFRLLVRIAGQRAVARPSRSTVFVLDEFQFLADGDAGVAEVASELNAVWEQPDQPTAAGSSARRERAQSATPLLLVLAGSAVSTMQSLATGGAPLYGRFAWQHKLQPFTYRFAGELTPYLSLRDKAACYGIFGGTPRYLAALEPQKSLARNVADLLLSPRGEVRLLVETALDQEEGLRDTSRYRAIMRAVADGCNERNEIAQRTGLSNDHALREKLATLMELGYLEARGNLDARPNEAVRYAIADPVFRFYHRFVAPNLSVLERYSAISVFETAVLPELDAFLGHEFERIASQAYDHHAEARALPMVKQWGRWEGKDRSRQSLEVDIVAPLVDGRIMTGAVKWERRPLGAAVHRAHMLMLQRAADAGRAWAHQALENDAPLFYVAASGFTSAFRKEVEASGHPFVCWSLEDLYAG